jgi:hypothetical protein
MLKHGTLCNKLKQFHYDSLRLELLIKELPCESTIIINHETFLVLVVWLRQAGAKAGPGSKWQGLGPALSISGAATAHEQ